MSRRQREQRALARERVRAEASRVERARLRLFEESTRQTLRTSGFVGLGLLLIVLAPWLLSLVVR